MRPRCLAVFSCVLPNSHRLLWVSRTIMLSTFFISVSRTMMFFSTFALGVSVTTVPRCLFEQSRVFCVSNYLAVLVVFCLLWTFLCRDKIRSEQLSHQIHSISSTTINWNPHTRSESWPDRPEPPTCCLRGGCSVVVNALLLVQQVLEFSNKLITVITAQWVPRIFRLKCCLHVKFKNKLYPL